MIPCANPLAQYQTHNEEILETVKRVLEGGNYILGPEVERFEKAFATYCGTAYSIGVNSGTDALILALRAMGIGMGDEVITVSHTALATLAAIIASGATPVLVDIDPVYYTMDPECFKQAITSKTKAVIPVHLYGQPADMDAIMKVAREHALFVIEDCAQATGAIYNGKRLGSMGDVGCFSFYPTKNLGAIGDGGAVVTSNVSIANRVRQLRQYGWDGARKTEETGLNSRLDEIQAAILNVKLKSLDEDNRRRNVIAQTYDEMLSELAIKPPKVRPNCTHVFHLYVVGCDNRDVLKMRLAEGGVFAGIHYPIPGHRHSGYDKNCVFTYEALSVTEKLVETILSFPMYPEISNQQLDSIRHCIQTIQV